jgi:hypothetical protein
MPDISVRLVSRLAFSFARYLVFLGRARDIDLNSCAVANSERSRNSSGF